MMTALFTLLDLDEPAYLLNGRLLPAEAGTVQVATGPDAVVSYPAPFRPVLRYFSRLRTRSEASLAGRGLDFDADDVAALRRAGVLWTLEPGTDSGIIDQLSRIRVHLIGPPAPEQNRPGFVVLQADDGKG